MKPILGSNNNGHNKDINHADLTNSKIVLFDEHSSHPVSRTRIKPTSPLKSFRTFVQQAINAIRAAFNFKTHQIPTSNIKADIIPKAETLKNEIKNQSIADRVNIISPPLNKTKVSSNDPLLDDFNLGGDIKIKDENKNIEANILVETASLIDERTDEIQTENYGAFAHWFKSGADIKVIPNDAIDYAKYLIRTHVDNEKIQDIPELLVMVEAAKNLVQEVERREPSFFELGLALKIDAQKEIKNNASFGVVISERSDEDVLKKYLNQESQRLLQLFYPKDIGIQNQSEIDQIKNDAKTFLLWKTLWSPIMTKSRLTAENHAAVSVKTLTEEEKNIITNEFKKGELTVFNNKHLASISDLVVCKRFIEKYESIEQIGSEIQKNELDILGLNEYIQDFKKFYLTQQSIKIKEKEEAKLKIEKHAQALSAILPEIIIFQSLNTDAIQALHAILAPELPLSSFQQIISDAKSYFSSIGNNLIINDNQRVAALDIATLWTKLIANNKLKANKPEQSNFFSQFFSRDLLAELKAFPHFEQLDTLLNQEKIIRDYK